MLLTGRFYGEIVITGYSMLMMSPLLDMMDLMKRIDCLWISASCLHRTPDIADGFAQVSAQGDVSLPGR